MSSMVANQSARSGPMANNEDNVDREKKCPLLLRVFINTSGRHYHLSEYSRGNVPSKEVQIYTWMDATLKELTGLVKEVNQDARKPGTRFEFALVFPDARNPMYRIREIGMTINGRKEPDDMKTLAQSRFQIGDFLDVAISSGNGPTRESDHDRSRSDRIPLGGGGGGSSARSRYNGDRDHFGDRRDRRDRPY
ncbi:histone deacetylase complex subunit SAP18 [Dermatophagoides farinae]|uniref:18 kDa Sin3-associated polypeptide n=1 Tax=Dermatophagoides farinae TaxID=6954 RepID=A0A922L931_DERFA|nr:histone deacetylase complex subunit SAP18-like [Dermatophagoides farinae]KAH7641325.1 histone deacetylase complex subunit sap18-like protein [Dermatophagoides farinae]KAH9527094.1 Histone deacetylase complex subunit sap18 [Dermatophagoides farinae]